jgi:hypothetical protein
MFSGVMFNEILSYAEFSYVDYVDFQCVGLGANNCQFGSYIFKFPASKFGFSSMCCKSLPGVQTMMLQVDIRPLSNFKSLPPMTRPAEKS